MPRLFLTVALLPLAMAACAGSDAPRTQGPRAVAALVDAEGRSAGQAVVTQAADGLWIEVSATGIAPGPHGMHVHAVGSCTAPDFTSAGPHWNPAGHEHGRKNPKGAHAGDAPNLVANDAGAGTLRAWLGAGTLTSGPNALLDADGASVVVHADPDDEMTDPSGKSGKRILCGVLTAR